MLEKWHIWTGLAVVVFLSGQRFHAEAFITFNTPSGGNGSAASPVIEGSTSGTVITVNATSDDGAPITYFIISQSENGTFEMISDADGVISVASGAMIDYETLTEHVIVVGATNLSVSATASVTVSISDKNDNTPVFSKSIYIFTATDGTGGGNTVGTVSATDADGSAPNNVITYSITGGLANLTFDINNSTGELSVASDNTLSSSAGDYYSLEITGTDNGSPAKFVTSEVLIALCTNVQSSSSAIMYSFGLMTAVLLLHVFRQGNNI